MERLTTNLIRKKDGGWKIGHKIGAEDIQLVFDRLTAYEDTMPLDRAQELAQAENDGRLVVLPCRAGDTVYRVITTHDTSLIITEIEIKTLGQACGLIGRIGETRLLVSWYLTREEAEAALKKRVTENETD